MNLSKLDRMMHSALIYPMQFNSQAVIFTKGPLKIWGLGITVPYFKVVRIKASLLIATNFYWRIYLVIIQNFHHKGKQSHFKIKV